MYRDDRNGFGKLFTKMKFTSTKFGFLMPFWNQNGNFQQKLTFCQKIQDYRFGSKKTQISKILLEMENITSQLSKSGLRMSLRRLDRFLYRFEIST